MRRPKGSAAFHTRSSEVLGAGVVPAGSPPKTPDQADQGGQLTPGGLDRDADMRHGQKAC